MNRWLRNSRGCATSRAFREVAPSTVSGSKTRHSTIAHIVNPRLSSQKSPNPFRMLSLRSMYVYSCMENNILFAYCAPRAHNETSIPSFITRRSVRLIFVW